MLQNIFLACGLLVAGPALAQSPSPSPAPEGVDSDGDGLSDDADPYPCDANAGGVIYVPSEGEAGTIFFEDQWPMSGDLDFNDVVVSFNYAFHVTPSGQVSSIRATYNVAALGGKYDNGLGLRLPITNVASVVRRVGDGDPTPAQTFGGLESDLVVRASPNLRELFGGQPEQINSLGTMARRSGETLEVTITFDQPQDLYAGEAPFDLFIFRAEDPSHEIHLPNYPGTFMMNDALFRTGDDNTNFEGTWFVDRRGLPFALMVPVNAVYPIEGAAIDELYPDIVEFAGSGGEYGNNFYSSNVVETYAYRDVNGLGPITPVLLPPPSTDRCCIVGGSSYEYETPELFSYDDLSEGTPLTLDDDELSAPIALGFPFTFDGQGFSQVRVSSNGFISFVDDQNDGCCEGQAPGPQAIPGVVAGFWEDLNPTAGGVIRHQTLGEGSAARWVVEFLDVPHFGEEGGGIEGGGPEPSVIANGINTVSFQIVLFASGEIEIRLLDAATDGGTHFVGVTSLTGASGAVIAYGNNFSFGEQAFRIFPFSSSESLTGGPYYVEEYGEIALYAGCTGGQLISWDFDGDGEFDDGEGPSPVFSAAGYDGPASHPVTMRSCDMTGNCQTYPSIIEIENVDPIINSTPPSGGSGGALYQYQATAYDPAGEDDPLEWSLVDGPAGMTVDPATGLLSWQIPASAVSQPVTLAASDGDGTSYQSWVIDIVSLGPDAYGYSYADAAFSWEDISSSGARITLGDDQVSGALPLGFGFGYYGSSYANLYVSSNGFVTFLPQQSNGCCSGNRAGTGSNPDGFIAGFWEDLYPPGGGSIAYQTLGAPGARRFIVQFTNVPHFGGGNLVSFQIVLFEADGSFEIRSLDSRTDGGQHSVGFQAPGGQGGLSIRFGSFTLTNTAWRVTAP